MWDVKNSPTALSGYLCLKDIPYTYLRNKFITLAFFTTLYILGQVFNYFFLFRHNKSFVCVLPCTQILNDRVKRNYSRGRGHQDERQQNLKHQIDQMLVKAAYCCSSMMQRPLSAAPPPECFWLNRCLQVQYFNIHLS